MFDFYLSIDFLVLEMMMHLEQHFESREKEFSIIPVLIYIYLVSMKKLFQF
jgi:hypothetical protein